MPWLASEFLEDHWGVTRTLVPQNSVNKPLPVHALSRCNEDKEGTPLGTPLH